MSAALLLASLALVAEVPAVQDAPVEAASREVPQANDPPAEPIAAAPTPEPPLPGKLRALRIIGLEGTHEHVVRRELGWREGEPIDEHAWSLGLTRVWNTVLFARVAAKRIAVEPGVFDAEVTVSENFTIFPVFTGTATRDILWVRAGLSDLNVFGHYREAGFVVERFNDTYGGDLFFREPRLFDERMELFVQGSRLARPRPGFTLLRAVGRTDVARLFADDRVRLALRFEGGYDDYAPPLTGEPTAQVPGPFASVSAPTRLGRIDRRRATFGGLSLDIFPSLVWSKGASGVFASTSADARAYGRWPWNLNAAARVVGAVTGAVTDNFQPFVGGTETVRGYPDSFSHGPKYAATNLELRWSALEWEYLVVMPTAFFDAAVVDDIRAERRVLASVGGGVRFIVPTFPAAGVRIDLAAPLTGGVGPGLSLGSYQFFW